MKGYYVVKVVCDEKRRVGLDAGSYSGVAENIEGAIVSALAMAADDGGKTTGNYRAVSAHRVGNVQFGIEEQPGGF